jgi:outer membrane receptor for ferric coprogen and ferric-rhodotorulic acid
MKRRILPPFFQDLNVAAAALLLAALPVFAAALDAGGSPFDKVLALDVARQPLDDALRSLAKQANLQVVFDAALVSGVMAPVVKARTSPRLVIERWLSGTHLIAEEQSPGVIVVREGGGARKQKIVAPVKRDP